MPDLPEHPNRLAVYVGQLAPGPLHLLDVLLKEKLLAAADSTSDAQYWVREAQEALALAVGPSELIEDGRAYKLTYLDRYKGAARSAVQLAAALRDAREAVKVLRDLAVIVEQAAELTAAQLDIPHQLPQLDS